MTVDYKHFYNQVGGPQRETNPCPYLGFTIYYPRDLLRKLPCLHFLSFHVLKVNIRIVFVDWRDGAEVRSAYYSCRGHQFCSQHHTGVLQSPVALAPEELPLDLYSQIYISTHKYIYTQLKRKFKK